MEKMDSLIVNAIRNRRVIRLNYDGRSRSVEPHAYGLDKAGNAILLCYEGFCNGSSREAAGWKQFRLFAVDSVVETPENFACARAGYKRNDTGLAAVFAQI
jgi:hypothetical protein